MGWQPTLVNCRTGVQTNLFAWQGECESPPRGFFFTMGKAPVLYTLMFFLVVFCIIFVVSIIGLSKKYSLLPLGMSYAIEDWIVIIFSIAGILKCIYDIVTFETGPVSSR